MATPQAFDDLTRHNAADDFLLELINELRNTVELQSIQIKQLEQKLARQDLSNSIFGGLKL